jgi:SM-20-related protein
MTYTLATELLIAETLAQVSVEGQQSSPHMTSFTGDQIGSSTQLGAEGFSALQAAAELPLDPFVGELPPELELELLFDRIADTLVAQGYIVVPQSLPESLIQGLCAVLAANDEAISLQPAGVGRAHDFQLNRDIRRDKILWLEPSSPALADFLTWMDKLRIGLNRRLYLGLREYESHFAVYEPGAFYQRHLDAFRGRPGRKLSTVLYLNPSWDLRDGGELLLYNEAGDELLESIAPTCGKLVVFLSEDFPHEVLVARQRRQSIAGWFRI